MASNIDRFVTPESHASTSHAGLPGIPDPGVCAQEEGGNSTGYRPTLNFAGTGATSVSVVENVQENRIDITINSTDTNDLSTFEVGGVRGGDGIGPGPGSFIVSSGWPGSFAPRGLVIAVASPAPEDDFFTIGWVRGTASGIASQSCLGFKGGLTAISASSDNVSRNPGTGDYLTADTPLSTSWSVTRSGATTSSWSYSSVVIGRSTV